MKICSNCQNTLKEDNKFCNQCGNPYLEELSDSPSSDSERSIDQYQNKHRVAQQIGKKKDHLPSALLLFSILIFMIWREEGYLISVILTFVAMFVWNKQRKYADNPNSISLPESIIITRNRWITRIHRTESPSIVRIRSSDSLLILIFGLSLMSYEELILYGVVLYILSITLFLRGEGELRKTRFTSIDFTKRSKYPLFISYLGLLNIPYILFFHIPSYNLFPLIIYSIALILLGLLIYLAQPPDQIRKEINIQNQFFTIIFLILTYSIVTWYDIYLEILELALPLISILVSISVVLLMKNPKLDNTVFDFPAISSSKEISDGYTPIVPQTAQAPVYKQPASLNNQQSVQTEIRSESSIATTSGSTDLGNMSKKLYRLELRHNNINNNFQDVEQEVLKHIPEKLDKIDQDLGTENVNTNILRRVLASAKVDTQRVRNRLNSIGRELNLLKFEASNINILDQLDILENKIKEMRERVPLVTEKINEDDLTYKKTRLELHNALGTIDEKISTLEKSLPQPIPVKKQRSLLKSKRAITDTKVEISPKIEYGTASFKLKSLISEKIISNLFAYVGALFITLGFFFLLNYTYNNFILKSFPADVDEGQAILGTSITYVLGLIFALSSIFLPRIKSKLTGVSRLTTSLGLIILQFAFFVQTTYFVNINLDANYLIFPGIILAVAGVLIGYMLKSQLVSLVAVGIGMYNGLIMGFGQGESSLSILQDTLFGGVGGPFAIFFFNALLLAFCVVLVLRRQIWLPLVIFSLLSPVIWQRLHEQSTIMTPTYLVLFVAIAVIFVVITKKMPTPKPFAHFLGLLFLIYPNIMGIIYTLESTSALQSSMSSIQILNTIVIFSSFYVLYWVFVFFEKNIELSFEFPVSFNFSTEKLKLRPIQQRLNWLLLTSLILLFTIVSVLRNTGNYDPIIFFSILLAIMAGIGIKLNFNEYVKNSVILMLIEAEVVFFLSLENPNASSIGISIVTAIFLISFLSNYQIINRYRRTVNLYILDISPYLLAVFISIFSIANFLLAAESEEYGTLVLLLSAITWIGLTSYSLITKNKDTINAKIAHTGIISGLTFLFLYGLLRQNRRFPIDPITKSMSALTHTSVNLSLGFYLIFALIMIIFGSSLKYNETVQTTFGKTKSFFANVRQLMVPNQLYTSHIIIFALPSILIAFGFPYFYYPTINQAVLMLYFVLYFLLLPLLVIISRIKRNHVFGTLAAFTGYFAFLGGFVLLGGAKKLYDIIVQPPVSSARGVYFIDPEWAIFLIVVIFIATVAWVIALSKKSLKIELTSVSEKSKSTTVKDEDKSHSSDKAGKVKKEEVN